MRCACPRCDAFMEHAETSMSCVCPQCLYRCSACLGTDSVISREDIHLMFQTNPDASVPEEIDKTDKEKTHGQEG